MYHETSLAVWVGFVIFILLVLLLDLGVFHKKSHTVGFKESIIWSGVWIALALAFAVIILYWRGQEDFMLFLTGYVIEKSLSVDNLFVFLLIFGFFKIPNQYQHKVLFYGILGALIMRAFFIWAGIAILTKFEWVIYIFGAFLVYSGIKMLMPHADDHDLEKSWVINWTKKIFPTTPHFHDDKFFVKLNGAWMITPLFITLIFVEFSDLVFAIDSIPAIIGITNDPFLVFTSNVFAILGLRSLYFALKGFADMFHYLKYGLALILMFIGAKMLIIHWFHMPVAVTMAVIFTVLLGSVLLSIWSNRKKAKNA
ncbi:TerC family protein [Peredibacter starrii]|uniref:TerC family protein n=1 Tax=Peredibacter starrii TaxID=28202 RepID=A0AAX4HNE9_9BACT|nr:TerC family protein [Peredibacter starrii]WPU64814.1 TerC family protein [Peredibacter starrii]